MEYSNAANQRSVGGLTSGVLGGASNALNVPKQPTIASAVGRLEGLNGRLQAITAQLSQISDAVGGPRPTGIEQQGEASASGIVYRLNDGTDQAHRQCSDIEELLAVISRALG